jgi:hypothetical protein
VHLLIQLVNVLAFTTTLVIPIMPMQLKQSEFEICKKGDARVDFFFFYLALSPVQTTKSN